MTGSFIGTGGWDPMGHSALSVFNRMCYTNRLNLSEAGRLFGKKEAQTFSGARRNNVEHPDGIHPERLCIHSGWAVSALRYSFSDVYALDPPSSEKNIRYKANRLNTGLKSRVTLCERCASSSTHLLFHQLIGWSHCPIHKCPLIDQCPRCESDFGPYQIDTNYQRLLTSCFTCGWQTTKRREVAKHVFPELRTYLSEYTQWLEELRFVISGYCESKVVFGEYHPINDLTKLEQLVPGPTWLRECLDTNPRILVDESTLPNVQYAPRPKKNARPLPNRIFVHDDQPVGTFLSTLSYRTRLIVEIMKVKLDEFAVSADRLEQVTESDDFMKRVYENAYSSTTVRSWIRWEAMLDKLFPGISQIDRELSSMPVDCLISGSAYDIWRHKGAGRLCWQKDNGDVVNEALVNELSTSWWYLHLIERFWLIWGRTVLDSHAPILSSSYKDTLDVESPAVSSLGSFSIFLVENVGCDVLVKTLSTMCESESFQDFVHSRQIYSHLTGDEKHEADIKVCEYLGSDPSILQHELAITKQHQMTSKRVYPTK